MLVPSAGREAQRLCEASGVSAGTCFIPQTCPTCPCPGVPAPYGAFRAPQQPKRMGGGCSRPCPCPGCPPGLHLLRPPPAAEQLCGGPVLGRAWGFNCLDEGALPCRACAARVGNNPNPWGKQGLKPPWWEVGGCHWGWWRLVRRARGGTATSCWSLPHAQGSPWPHQG